MKNKYAKQKGFTLVELLIVIVILGLLSTIGIGSFISSQKKGRDARRKADLESITRALELYYNDNDQYPESSGGLILGCDGAACGWNQSWDDQSGGVTYMVQLPSDPGRYAYSYSAPLDGSYYILFARLENLQDSDVPPGPSGPGVYSGTSCGTDGCNYMITSSNGATFMPSVIDD